MSTTGSTDLAKGVGRAFAGAMLFSLPILMTMEMWQLGVTIDRWRLALLLALTVVLAFKLESYFGMRNRRGDRPADTALDVAIALLVGLSTAALILVVLSVVHPLENWQDAVSVVAIEALPATIGASYARSQLGDSSGGDMQHRYTQELFLMAAGAVVFAANIAPTEEVVLLASMMDAVHGVVLVVLVLTLMHVFVYAVDFKGGSVQDRGFWAVFMPYTLVGYGIALSISAYVLWTFGRFDDTGLVQVAMESVVLALPAGLGAAAARLIL